MKSEWIAKYEETNIKITNHWFSGKKLHKDNKLQDEQLNFITPTNWSSYLNYKQGQNLNIKTNISGFFTVSGRLFIVNKKVELKQTK